VLPSIQDCPDVLRRSPKAITELRDTYLRIGVSFEKVVKRTPRLLMRDAQLIQKAYDFFLDGEIGPGMEPATAAKVVESSPMLLIGMSDPQRRLAPLVSFLKKELKVDPSSKPCLAFYTWPDALGLIEKNFRFLTDACGFSAEALQHEVALLAYSFEARIFPRSHYAHELGCRRPSLHSLAVVDDKKFCEAIGASLQDYQTFARRLRTTSSKHTASMPELLFGHR